MEETKLHRIGLAARLAREAQHELNNIMAAAFGYTNLMVARGGEADIGEHLRGTLIRTRNLMERYFLLLRDVPEETRPVPVRKLMQDLTEFLKVYASHHLITQDSPALEVEVDVHLQKVIQSLLEIVLGIREACEGDVSASVTCHEGRVEMSFASAGGSLDTDAPDIRFATSLLQSLGAQVEFIAPARVCVMLPEHVASADSKAEKPDGPVFLSGS